MQIYFAPLEGITGYAFRNTHRQFFPGVEKYYAPFISPNYTHHLKGKERADVEPANNPGMPLVPQVLSNHAEDFLWAAGELYRMGYREVNLNLGCPMPTVVRRKRGAGQLADLDALDRFLEEVCRGLEDEFGPAESSGSDGLRFSVKTRIGLENADHAEDLLAVYNRYPISELTVHPRTQKDMYRNTPDLDVFAMFAEESVHPLVYNGDICSMEDYEKIKIRFPGCRAVMLGRGLIADPALVREIRGGEPLQKKELREYHDALLEAAVETLPGAAPVLGHMKELWFYMAQNFPGADRYIKEIRKAKTLVQYQGAVRTLFTNARFR